jgi:hypothetical protein
MLRKAKTAIIPDHNEAGEEAALPGRGVLDGQRRGAGRIGAGGEALQHAQEHQQKP